MPDEPMLFDLPEPARAPARQVERGRARETWKRTVTVDIEVVQPDVVRRTALKLLKRRPAVELQLATDAPDPRAEITGSSRGALQWIIDPTRGLASLLEAGAVDLVAAGIAVEELSVRSCRATWFTTIKLRDVSIVRRHAVDRSDANDEEPPPPAARPFPETWNDAADAYAPVRGLSGITWNSRALRCEVLRTRKR